MKKIAALFSLTVLAGMALLMRAGSPGSPGGGLAWAAPQQAEGQKPAGWSGRDEYDAYMGVTGEKDPQKRIGLADAFLQKYPNSFVKDTVYVVLMQTYAQLNDVNKAIDAAHKAVAANPDKLEALTYLSFVFPFVFKGDDPEATTKLSQAENDAKRGLDALQKLKKPDNVTEEQFTQYVKQQRANFNGSIGFVALQRKDYAAAITSFKTSAEDNPADVYTFYRLGIAHISADPRDYDNAIWSLARSASLAKAGNNPAAPEIERYLKQVYINYHGNDEGLAGIMAQAAASPTPPEGFKVAPMETPKPTGNASVDAFNQTFFMLKLGGERAQKLWDSLKGQPFGVGGFIESVEKGADAGQYVLKIDVLEASKAADGVYDIELKDSTQPNVKNLGRGDAVHFQGTISSYAAAPNLVITLEGGKINEDEIPDQPRVQPKAKPKPKPKPRVAPRRTTSRPRT
jgi:tetratricopeptide (TPR) repeat protein